MKKAKMIGKKTLSVFLAVLMVLTAWVWVAPTEAEAANGSYYVKISWTCDDAANDYDTEYLGKGTGTDNNVGISLFYTTNNGRGEVKEKYWDIQTKMAKKGDYSETATISGFPSSLYAYNNNGGMYLVGDKGIFRITKIEVGSSSSNLKTLWTGEVYLNSTVYGKEVTLTSEGKQKDSNDTSNAKVTTSTVNWVFPYVPSANSIYYDTNKNVSDIGIPPLGDSKDVDKSTHSIQYYAYDYYGVRYEPTSYTVTGVSGLTTGSGWSCGNAYPITATTSTTKSTVSVNQTATVTMNWNNGTSQTGQKANTTETFSVYNPRYKVTFNGNGGTLGTNYTYAYYGRAINHSTSTATSNNVAGLAAELFPTTGIKEGYTFSGIYTAATGGSKISAAQSVNADVTYYAQWVKNNYTATFYGTKANESGTGTLEYVIETSSVPFGNIPTAPATVDKYSLGDYDYTFESWDKAISAIGVNGAEYRATYKETFVPAVYTEVNKIVDEANSIINSENYEAIYSEESRHALELAVNNIDYNLGRTSQTVVDNYVTLIREAIDGLGRQKYSVIFIDQTDNSVIEMRYPVYYGDEILMPKNPVKGFDSNYHYTFNSWQPSEAGDDITFVVKNMIIYATFDKIAHTYTDTQLPSNCTTQAGVLHKCSCGYEYVEYSGSVGTEHSLETEWTIDIAPTCTSAGSKSYHCTRCSYRDSVTEIPALGHDLVYQGVVISPGCENDGAEVSECQRCGYDNYTIIPSGNHNWTEQVVAPTCTSSGYTIKTCSICGDEDIVSFVDPIAHTYVENTDEYIAPTCTGLGKKVSYCTCGAQKVETVSATGHQWNTDTTTDFEATCTTKGQQSIHCSVCDIINQESITEIPENGHTWGNEVCEQKETCGVKGLYVKTCTVCGEDRARTVEALAHNYDTSTVAPTCTTKGYTIETCSKCGDVKYTNEKPALNHAWTSTTHDADCTHSAYIEHVCGNDASHNFVEYVAGSAALTHDFKGKETIISDATCTSDGQKTVQCTRCDAVNEVIIPKLGHSYGAWEVVKEATNNEDGKWTRKCVNCNDVETVVIPAGGHTFNTTTPDSKTDPKCTTPGSATYKCKTEGHTCGVEITVEIPVKEHSIAIDNKEASCTEKGHSKTYCSVCKKEFNSVEIPVKAHNFVAQDAVAPTCTTAGYTPYKCSACGFTYNVFDGAQATGHNYTAAVTKDATCTEEGVKTFICQNDNSHKYTETIPATGHTYDAGTVVKNQSCTDVEKTEYKCACGDKYTVITKEAKGHTYTNWTVITPATADKSGVQKGTCACGDVKYDVLAPIGAHSFTETITKNPSCTEKGEKTFVCNEHENCSANYKAEIPATGHTQKIVYTAPTCITAGSTKVVCSVESCKAEILSTSIPATSKHDFSGEGKVTTAPTCTVTGIMTYTCTTVGCTTTKTETIPAKGHVLSTTVNDAKCGEKGSVVTECANCNDPSVENTVELSAKGHIWGATPIETKAADCENNGSETYKCQYCDATNVVVLPKLGHNWSEWVKVDATTTTDGSWYHKCQNQNCGKEETLAIPKGHNLVIDKDKSKAATCEADGVTVYKCDSHTDCGITISVTHKQLNHSISSTRTEATCSVNGQIERKCLLCEKVIATEILYAKAHEFKEGVPHKATCTEAGYVEYQCKNCTYSYKAFAATEAAKGHTLVMGDSTATCVSKGNQTVYCNVEGCGYTTTIEVPATGHSHVKGTVTTATCTTVGREVYTCSCGDTYTKFISGTVPHSWRDWTITQAATADKYGIKERTCSVCNTVEIGKVAPIGNHTFVEKIEKEATCTDKGEKSFTCSAHTNCTANYTEEIPAKGHTQKLEYIAPSCTAIGYSKVVCSVEDCNALILSAEILAKGHAYNTVEVTKEPGCESTGTRTYSCSCGASYTEEIPAKGHAFKTEVNDATCESTGKVVTTCENCTSYKETITLAAKNHNWNAGVENPKATCTSEGTITYTCTVDGCGEKKTETVEKLDHEWNEWTVTPSTNGKEGSVSRKCKNCTETETIKIPAGGHNLVVDTNNSTDATCTREGTLVYKCEKHTDCGITVSVTVPMIQHTLTTTKKDATCTNAGEVVTKCTKCETSTFTTIIPAKGHTITVTVTPATCTTDGSVVEYCEECKTTLKTTTIAKLIHDYSGTETIVTKATCTTDGEKKVKCKTCDATTNVVIPKLGHIWNGWVKKEATNDTDGSWSRECTRKDCDAKENLTIPAGGHKLVEDKSQYKAPTCTDKGQKVYVCNNTAHENCSVTVTVELDYGPHTIAQKLTEATCKVEGSVKAYCSVCDVNCANPFSIQTIPVKAHVYKAGTAVAPTCTTAGYTTYKCSVCGQGYTSDFVEANGHKYNEGEKTDATCTTAGKIVYTCTAKDCAHSYEVTLSMLNHEYDVENTVDPTCTANGYTTYKCKTCDSRYGVIGDPAKTHNYSTVVSSTATCTAGGTLTLKCADCEHTMETAVPALGHDYKLNGSTSATCAKEATETYKCSRCTANYTVSVGAKTDAHDWNDWFTVKEADYTSIGYKTRTCKVCGKLEVETINATGAHDLQEVKRDAPTCTEKGKIYYECKSHSDCGIKNEVEIPALGHDEKLSYKAATCTEAGFTKIICNVKGCDYEAEATTIPALGHAWNEEAATIVNATCQSEGSVSLGCKNCNKTTEVVIPVNADAHKTVVTTNKATCTEAGSVVTSCELCKKELLTTTLTALGHDWSAWDINPSTYTAPGSMSRICQTCKEPETVEIPAGGHKFNNVPSSTTAATCAAEGSATYKCSAHVNCGVEVTVKLSKVHHNLKIDTVDASCTNGGSITVSCVNCDYTSIITTGILAHEYQENGTVAATCTTAGYTIMKCKNCEATYNRFDSQPLGHNFDDSIADNVTIVAAKCEEDGSKTVKCSRKDCDETKVTVIPATGHKYENEKSSVTTAPTCTAQGYTTYTCDVCKVSYTTNFVKPKGHDWGDWMVASGADGDVIKRVCKTDANHTEQYNIPSGGHSFDTTKPAATVQGTCQAEGSMKFNCTAHEKCGVTITVNTGFGSHNWSQWEIKAATNEADGSWTHKCLTSGCNESETLVIPRGHYLAEDSKQYVKPECNKVGQRVYTCTAHDNCTVKIVVVLEMTQHTIVTVNEAATCQNDGLIKTYCEKCGKVFSDITLKKVPHDYDKNKDGKLDTADAVYTAPVQNADGTWTPGYYTFTCQTAGCEDTKVEGDSTSYEVSFFDGNGDLVATTIVLSGLSATAPAGTPVKDADGNYHYTFSGWDRDFSKIEKDLDVYATFEKEAHFGGEATCNTKAICDKCNKAYGNVDESKHIIVTKSKSASCEADGWVEYYCTSEGCEYNYSTGKYLKKETIGASGHVYGQWKVVQNGTCEIPQIQQRKCINYGCNKVEEKLSQSTHTWLLEPRIEPTCSSVGYTEFKYCVTCNLQIDRVEIPKIDHRDLDGNGYCDFCGTSKGTPKCNCMCHSTGIMKFFYKIVRFFWMITKSSRSCSCGAVHY